MHSYVSIPIFSHAATLVLGPSQVLPSGVLVSELLKVQSLSALYIPPSIIEQWMAEPDAIDQASTLKFIVFGGGPLSPTIGDKLEKVTRLCQTYGFIETSGIQLLVPYEGEWSYLEFNPYEMCDMQNFGDGMYELVLHQQPKVAWMRVLSHNFPETKTWRTGDLFTRHASKANLWRFCSRVDDLVVMSNGLKVKPIPMELIIQGSPFVNSALIAGQGRVEPILLIEPSDTGKLLQPEELYKDLRAVIEEANLIAPAYAQISSSKIIIGSSDRPFVRAPKGTVVRKLTTDLYAPEIDKAYSDEVPTGHANSGMGSHDERFSTVSIEKLVRQKTEKLASNIGSTELSKSDNFYLLGLDSLKMALLAYDLRRELGTGKSGTRNEISLRLIYRYPTIQALSDAIYNLHNNPEVVDEKPVHDINTIERMVREPIPGISIPRSPPCNPSVADIEILILGPRGSLGPSIVRALLQDRQVVKIHCMNRSSNGRERLRAIFEDRGFKRDFDDSRLEFYSIDTSKEHLGLEEVQWDFLRSRIHFALHNAWKVDFSLPLDFFEREYIRSVRTLLQLCRTSQFGARLIFCSSISSVQEWANLHPGEKVPEAPIGEEDFKVSSPLGYGQSKQVSERIMARASIEYKIPVTILRIGQVAGPTAEGGSWSNTEWIPALAEISQNIRMMPVDLPDMDWIPSDTLSRIIRELILETKQDIPLAGDPTLSVFNLVNTRKVPPTDLLDVIRARTESDIKAVTLKEWVEELAHTAAKSSPLGSQGQENSEASLIVRMLPWFQHLEDTVSAGRTIQPEFETGRATRASPTMASLKPITKDLLGFWCSQWGI